LSYEKILNSTPTQYFNEIQSQNSGPALGSVDYIYIGKVWGVYGEQDITMGVRNAARNCLHPSSTDTREQYKTEMSKLPHVEFFMRSW
jgi:hypothetical protein